MHAFFAWFVELSAYVNVVRLCLFIVFVEYVACFDQVMDVMEKFMIYIVCFDFRLFI